MKKLIILMIMIIISLSTFAQLTIQKANNFEKVVSAAGWEVKRITNEDNKDTLYMFSWIDQEYYVLQQWDCIIFKNKKEIIDMFNALMLVNNDNTLKIIGITYNDNYTISYSNILSCVTFYRGNSYTLFNKRTINKALKALNKE